jgi:voltage-gated potassium channel
MATRSARIGRPGGRKRAALVPSLVFTGLLLSLIALSIEATRGDLAVMMLAAVLIMVTAFHYLFSASRFFAFALANLTGVYACAFLFFTESNFSTVEPLALSIGFLAPLLAFLGGSLWRRRAIRRVILAALAEDEREIGKILLWLAPVGAIGAIGFFVPTSFPAASVDIAFLAAMGAIAAIVLFLSRDIAVFLLDTASLFEEFFERAAKLVAPAFAFLTFYSLLVIVFAAIYSIVDGWSSHPHFRIEGVLRTITFPESLYFSLTTLSTVGYGDISPASNIARFLIAIEIVCGVLLLLFGFNEIISYSRERQPPRRRDD